MYTLAQHTVLQSVSLFHLLAKRKLLSKVPIENYSVCGDICMIYRSVSPQNSRCPYNQRVREIKYLGYYYMQQICKYKGRKRLWCKGVTMRCLRLK